MRPSRHPGSACSITTECRGESPLPCAFHPDTSRAAVPSTQTRCRPHQGNDRCGIRKPSLPVRHLYFLPANRRCQESASTRSIPPLSATRDDPAPLRLLPAKPSRCRYPTPVKRMAANEWCWLLQFRNGKIPESRAASVDRLGPGRLPSAQKSNSSWPDKLPPGLPYARCVLAPSALLRARRVAERASTAAFHKP